MNKQEFLNALRKALAGLPQADIEERLTFYAEMIDDRIEDGLSQEQAVTAAGAIEEIVAQAVADTPLAKIAKERIRPKRKLGAGEIVLLALGSPIWLSLLLAAIAVILAVYIVLWAMVVVVWSVEASFVASSLAGVAAAVGFAVRGNALSAVVILGAALFCAGFSVFFGFVCKAATKGIIVLTNRIALGIKSLFVGKEAVK